MQRQYSWPSEHWGWPVKLTHKHGVRCGRMLFTGGQVDLSSDGVVLHPFDLMPQCRSAMQHLCRVLEDLGAELCDLVKLVVYYVGDEHSRAEILNAISTELGPETRPAISLVCLPALCYPGLSIEIEGVAMLGECNEKLARECLHLPNMPLLPNSFSHAVCCEEMIFTSDISAIKPDGEIEENLDLNGQTHKMMHQLRLLLQAANADIDDVVKLTVFYSGDGSAENWAAPASIRAACFTEPGPAATGLVVERFAHERQKTQISVTAMRATGGSHLNRQFSWPDNHWDWTVHLPYGQMIHVGGQVALNSKAEVIAPGDSVRQTEIAMENVKKVLAEFGATLNDVVNSRAFLGLS